VKLICPDSPALIARLQGRTLCVRVEEPSGITTAAVAARQRNTLACVICKADVSRADIDIDDGWHDVPLALMVPSIGRVRHLVKKLKMLRKSNVRVHLSPTAENLVGARILASLEIPVCIDLQSMCDWDALADVMTYALLGMVPHAPIEPFHTIAENYHTASRSDDWGRIFFDDPSHYLHLDTVGHIALSRRELLAGQFVGEIAQLDGLALKRAIDKRSAAWRNRFAENHFCARCDSWRGCRARLSDGKSEPDGCAAFFHEMTDVIDQRRERHSRRAQPWQP
jgi:hypothetical protein